MATPYTVKNTTMDGTYKQIKLEKKWNTALIKMRETNIAFTIREENQTNYFTVPAGETLRLSSFNYDTDYIEVKAASGTMEIFGFKRG